MGLDQTAKLRSRQVDWKKYYSQDRKESEKEQAGVLFGVSTQDFKFLWRANMQSKTRKKIPTRIVGVCRGWALMVMTTK